MNLQKYKESTLEPITIMDAFYLDKEDAEITIRNLGSDNDLVKADGCRSDASLQFIRSLVEKTPKAGLP